MKNRKFIQIILVAMAIFSLGSYLRAEVPAGYYYAADGKSGAELKTALHQIVSAMHTLDYGSGEGATWEGFSRTDRLDDGRVWDRYSSEVRYFDGYKAVDGMHIEHSFPKSWWGAYENNAYRDLHHLYPADGSANSSKNNLPLGEVTGTPGFDNGVSKIGYNGFGTDYTDRCFEPADEYKGDFARAYLYVVTAYENLYDYWQSPMVDNNTYPVWKNWARNLLLEWHRQDPPSEREMARNDSVYTIQGNRNPYIDYPDLVEYVWGDHVGQAYAFPEETAPFLAMPRYGESVDMGVILAGDSRSAQLEILGDNLTSALSIAWTQGNIFSLSATTLSPQQVSDGYSLEIACDRPAQGEYRDTLTIVGGGLERQYRIPVRLIVVPSFIVTGATDITASEATVQWVNYPSATDYRVSLWRGNTSAGDLIISAYVEGSSYNKSIELYNGTGAPVDLSAYSLRIESNGGGSFYNDTPLGNAVLQNGETWLLLNEQSTDATLRAKASQMIPGGEDSPLNFNGNDAVALCRNGIIIDVVGFAGEIAYWGQDKTLYRQSRVTHPSAVYDPSEWTEAPKDDFSQLGSFAMQFDAEREYICDGESAGLGLEYRFTGLRPLTRYTYRVDAVTPSATVAAAYSMQFVTDSLETPQLLDASEVTDTSFRINWEEVQAADDYEVLCFTQSGEQHTVTEGFDNVGSKGEPLPDGWSGNASGNYTSAASSGQSAPSVALKATGEYLCTPTYPQGIVSFSFMYRFASSGSGSYVVVEKQVGGNWASVDTLRYVNTSKYYPSYTFSIDEGVTAMKITYAHKATGNVAIDDATIVYGDYLNTVHTQERIGQVTSYVVHDLEPLSEYHYQVRALCDDVVSPWSPVQRVTTAEFSGMARPQADTPRVYAADGRVVVSGLSGRGQVTVYNLSGQLLYSGSVDDRGEIVVGLNRGIYLVRVVDCNQIYNYKVGL